MQRHCWNFDEPEIQCALDPEAGKLFCYPCSVREDRLMEISDISDSLVDNTD